MVAPHVCSSKGRHFVPSVTELAWQTTANFSLSACRQRFCCDGEKAKERGSCAPSAASCPPEWHCSLPYEIRHKGFTCLLLSPFIFLGFWIQNLETSSVSLAQIFSFEKLRIFFSNILQRKAEWHLLTKGWQESTRLLIDIQFPDMPTFAQD